MDEVKETVTLPAASDGLAQGVEKLMLAIEANHKMAAGNLLTEVSEDVTAAVATLGPILSRVGQIPDEAKADVVGVVEAFALAGAETARKLLAKPAVAAPVAEAVAQPVAEAQPAVPAQSAPQA